MDGLIRVGGRLKNLILSPDEKFPIILPSKCHFTSLIIRYYHQLTLHGGLQLTLSCVRRTFWIPRGKLKVKTCIKNCVTCTRFNNQKIHQQMGDLPAERVQPARPFKRSGIDYAGPYLLRTSKHRGYKSFKGYFVVFVCLCTKAVHLEAVTGYDAEAFIAAFKRFVARRGVCSFLISDQGTNFIGADAELRLRFAKGSDFFNAAGSALQRHGTLWKFNPPGAPHFGGLWEAAVKSVKYHLKRVIGETILTYEEFSTILHQVEACLNSRPLLPLADDHSGSLVLTPAHFLIGESSFLIAEPNIVDENVPPLQRWRATTQMVQRFWVLWSTDYLQQLQKRSKWKNKQPQFQIGDIVLLRHENTAPARWPMARVCEVFPGADGLVRVVSVKTATTTLRRPITKLVKLIEASESS